MRCRVEHEKKNFIVSFQTFSFVKHCVDVLQYDNNFFKTDKYFAVGEVDIVERSRDEVEGIIPQYLFPFGRIITEE